MKNVKPHTSRINNWVLTSKARFLKSCSVNVKTKKFVINNSSFSCNIYVFGVHTSGHCTNVPASQFKSGSLFTFMFVRWNSFSYFSLKAFPIHPMRKVNCRGTTPYWVRAVQLKAGGGCSMQLENSSYQRIRPLAPILLPNRIRLINGNCHIPCCVFAKNLRK